MSLDPRLERLQAVIRDRKAGDAGTSYVASLFSKGRAKIAQKVGEEATETVIAALTGGHSELTSEAADLLFHLMILLEDAGSDFEAVLTELERRDGVSGHVEKASRHNQ
jgi:phosphoribosyl-ATP pyrophosphohydrolase